MQQQAKSPAQHECRDQKACKTEALPQQICEDRPVMAEKIVRRRIDSRVERAIARVVGQQSQHE